MKEPEILLQREAYLASLVVVQEQCVDDGKYCGVEDEQKHDQQGRGNQQIADEVAPVSAAGRRRILYSYRRVH